jgi:hypothetical protein
MLRNQGVFRATLLSCMAETFAELDGSYGTKSVENMSTFYVDNTVSSSGNGSSWSSAWKHFSDINWASIKPGDTVYISGGSSSQTYDETFTVGASGSAGKPITITAGVDPGHNGTVVIDAQETRANGVVLNGDNYVDVQHLSVRDATDAGISVKNATGGVIIEDNGVYSGDPGGGNARGYDVRNSVGTDAVIVRGNSFSTPANTTAQTDGAWSSGNNGVVFEYNHFVIANSDTTGHSDGIQSFQDYNVTIRGNWVEQANNATVNNHGIWLSDVHTGGVINVYNNVVLAPNLTGDTAAGLYDDSAWTETGTAKFYNNTILGGDRALLFYNTPSTVEAKNNILSPAVGGRFGVALWNESTPIPGANIDHNLIWAPGSNVANVEQQGGTKTWAGWQALGYDAHGVNADPGFVDAGAYNYALGAQSAAVDHGATLSGIMTDYAGTSRPQGAGYDIGAYEFIPTLPGSGSSSSPVVSIGDASAHAGNVEVFNVALSNPSTDNVTATYQTIDGTALSDVDYAPLTGSITFSAGQTTASITVNTLNGHLPTASDETFTVALTGATNASVGKAVGTGTIIEDQASPVDTPSGAYTSVHPDRSGVAHGTAANEKIYATGSGETLVGGGGNDIFMIGTHTDATIVETKPGISEVVTSASRYTLPSGIDNVASTGSHAHIVVGNEGNNVLYGSNANDILSGGSGNDKLVVGKGMNILTGGDGSDSFVFSALKDHGNIITDFAANADMIDLRPLMKAIGYSGADPVNDGHLTLTADGHGGTVIGIDPDGQLGSASPHPLVTLQNVVPTDLHGGTNLIWH